MKKQMKLVLAFLLSLLLVFGSLPALAAASASGKTDHQLTTINQGTGRAILEKADYFGDLPDSTPVSVDIVLKVRNEKKLQSYIDRTVNPGSAFYHRYMQVTQFKKVFGASDQTVKALTQYLKHYQIRTKVYANNLIISASGTAGDFNKAFSVTLQKAKFRGRSFHAVKKGPKLPGNLAAHVLAVLGLTNYAERTPRAVKRPLDLTTNASGGPLNLDPADLIKHYNAAPLYEQGATGKGQTIGIVTLADFNTDDAYAFWKQEGINVKPDRIHKVLVDGGSDWNGYEETSLDVEQSGALAPQADVNVYIGPNTDAGFVNAFAAAINENKASQISVSWGLSESAINAAISDQTEDPAYALVFNQLFEQAAAQGISMFASAGDAGAYDASRDLGTYNLSVDNPADSPYITAAGGTTLPWTYTTKTGVQLNVSEERAWGWNYLYPYFDSLGLRTAEGWSKYYFVGGGGGFSQVFTTPDYQKGVSGVNRYTAVQQWQPSSDFASVTPLTDSKIVTGHASGRNMPDVSLNADPYTGYKVFTSDPNAPGSNSEFSTFGGTSVVSPQLAGLTALMNSAQKDRIGFWNSQIYRFAKQKNSPFHPLNTTGTENTNLYYTGTKGTIYNQSTGLGTIDVASLAEHFHNTSRH
ncbi:protease pro-enzyme activation domain-containing protein [Sporolactobacillus sp. CPB3-1]|uniref:Protease pro-enzyme activation domain-containing protein n=1 Tax=Sporolactobacillus mangiferae TaxID=2940498 RepID=A0ABT0M862_9BACL|nr:protease pro-enzyme activation domain-containing protein [Sporolactobacillus mangiferae]MCL1631056.1 protease pro-enzyme activation domain-containing protein [Sporolactobacillus mangiferae]